MIEGQIPIKEYKTGNTKHKWDIDKLKKSHKKLKKVKSTKAMQIELFM